MTEPRIPSFVAEAERRLTDTGQPGWLAEQRRAALDRFRDVGLPGHDDEDWRFTETTPILQTPFRPADRPPPFVAPPAWSGGCRVILGDGFVMGWDRPPAGVSIHHLSDARPFLVGRPAAEDRPMAALNAALFADGVLIRIAAGAGRPVLEVLSLGTGVAPAVFHPRLVVEVEGEAEAILVERHFGRGPYFANAAADIVVGDGARLRHYRIQAESDDALHIASAAIVVGEGAGYESFLLHLGGRLARHDLRALIGGEGAEFRLAGAFAAGAGRHQDTTTLVTHRAPGGTSRQIVKGALDGDGHGVFQGKVLVERGAQKTDAHQLSQTLLLSRQAEMDGKPELEIYANDVKCGHGASVGELDEAGLFYLRSRGLDQDSARRLLVGGFLAEATEQISFAPIRAAFAGAMERALARGFFQENSA